MKIQIKKLSPDVKIPQFALGGDAGMDLYSAQDAVLKPGERISCATGIATRFSEEYVGLVWDKSGVAQKSGIKTLGGVIDSNYTGEWFIGLVNLSNENYKIEKGQKIAQVLFQKIEIPEIEIVEELEQTNRGDGAFGSTGLN